MPDNIGICDQGDLVRLWGEFRDGDQDPIDPTTVRLSIRYPGGRLVTYTYGTDAALIKDSTGNFYLDFDASTHGTVYYRFFSTGTGQGADEQSLKVRKARAAL
jgi:hypothetical protein